jgi:hypothetical protein
MNELLELSKTFIAAGWVYLCVVLAIATGLLLFDRRRRLPDPGPGPAVARPRDPFLSEAAPDPMAADRA